MIDASIALGVKSPQIEDPMNSYAKLMQMQNAQQQNQLGMMQMDEYRRKVEEQNALRGLNPAHPDYQNQLMRVSPTQGIAYMKERNLEATSKSNIGKTKVETYAARAKLEEQELRNAQALPSDENLMRVRNRLVASGLYEPEELASIDALTQQVRALPLDKRAIALAQFGASSSDLKPTTTWVDQGRVKSAMQTPAFGGQPAKVGSLAVDDTLSPAALAQQLAKARASASNVNVTNLGETEYAKQVGGGAGKEDVTTYNAVQQLPADLAKVRETLNILKKSDINTGIGAELFTVLDKARAQVLADKKAGIRATGTEYLDSLLGSAVFPQIHALGIGAKGMDTPAEREFLRQVMTGTIGLTKDTLIKMTELREKGLREQGARFNRRVASGEMDNFFKASGRRPSQVDLGEPPAPPAASVDRIPAPAAQLTGRDKQALEWANANPLDPRAAAIKAHHGVR